MAAAKPILPKLVQYALASVDYTLTTFPDTLRDAAEIAELLNIPAAQLFKTLVVISANSKGKYLIMIAANQQLNLKRFAKAVGEKKLVMATHAQAEKLTKLQVGGISALALKNQPFNIYLEESAKQFEQIYVSGGQRGIDVKLSVADLIQITGARWVQAT